MKFQPGDKVLLVHSNEEGEVVDIINKQMVTVDVGGVQFPVYTDQLEFPYFKRFTEKKTQPPPQKKYIDNVKKEKGASLKQYKVGEGIWISFLPVFDKDIFDDDVVEYFRIYLVNNTDTSFLFDYHLRFTGDSEFNLKNEILPYNDFYIHDVEFEKLNDAPRFDFEFSLAQPDKKKAPHFEASLKLKAKQLFLRIEEMLKKQEASFAYLLMETYPDKVETEKLDRDKLTAAGYKVYDAGKARQHLPPARTVVDLHIEKISNNWKHLSNFEILTAQLNEFEKYYELAVLHMQPTLIVIHGVGEGKLRDEIHDTLRLKQEVKSFVNQYHPSYGYGATEIYFQY
ncbi:Smr/MutS family protein [Lacibacter sp. H407]|uniref:Smr/MutS family protein n=1 Tax=Lacibacter sp. H407 TaxID=3133423 RepID=UPI0030C0C666